MLVERRFHFIIEPSGRGPAGNPAWIARSWYGERLLAIATRRLPWRVCVAAPYRDIELSGYLGSAPALVALTRTDS